jgi:hypothetical protein
MSEAVIAPKAARSDWLWLFTSLGVSTQILAVVTLIRHSIELGSLSTPLQLIMDAYAATTRLLLGWTEPYLRAPVMWLNSYLHLDLTLYPHWKDFFMLFAMWALASNRARAVELAEKGFSSIRVRATIAWHLSRDLFCAVAGAMIAGLLTLQSDDWRKRATFVVLPFVIVLLSGRAKTINSIDWDARRLHRDLSFLFGMAVTTVYIAIYLKPIEIDFILRGSAFTGCAWLFLGSLLVWQGGNTARLGFYILSGFLGAALFFAADAGLKLMAS